VAIARAPWVADKVRVVYSGVDTKHFAPPESDRTRAELGPNMPFTFVISGRLEPRKGIDIALGALALVDGARLSVLGDGAERERLEARARAIGLADRVQFHGYVRDPRDVLATAHAVLCSSREEGLGIALLEAMAMGRPIVTVPVGGVPEIVKDGGTGWIARASTAESLAERMREAMRDVTRLVTMGRAARAFVERTCSLEHMCEGYGEVYASLGFAEDA
jgi:glycosyltransferase involved in cell wall biosynthesis